MEKENTWKKVIVNKIFTTYKKGKEDNFLTLIKQTYNSHAWGFKKSTEFIIGIGNHHTNHIEKYFKIKSKAVNFANEYIKNN